MPTVLPSEDEIRDRKRKFYPHYMNRPPFISFHSSGIKGQTFDLVYRKSYPLLSEVFNSNERSIIKFMKENSIANPDIYEVQGCDCDKYHDQL